MRSGFSTLRSARIALATLIALFHASCLFAQDWPQWRGPRHDGQAIGFISPTQWPVKLTHKWRTPVGLGDATPALANGRLYAFGRQGDEEIIRCLKADDGKEVWRYAYQAIVVTGAAEKYQGPRSSPAVADNKIVTLGVGGILTCLDAATGEKIWRKEELELPLFFTATSPLVEEGICFVHLGGNNKGVFVAVELSSGKSRWQWTGDGPSYSSPTSMTADGVRQIVMLTESNLLALSVSDGKRLWSLPTSLKPGYWNSASPVVEGQVVFFTGQGYGTKAVKIGKQNDTFSAAEIWRNEEFGTVYNTPVLKDRRLYGLSDRGQFFCLDASTGRTVWSSTNRVSNFGSIVDTGDALVALPEKSGLVVFKPNRDRYEEIARLNVSSTPVYAHPVLIGNRVFVRDAESVALWIIDP